MGDAEQVIAEPDELEGEDIEGLHPPTLEQNNPRVVDNIFNIVLRFLASNGWQIVILAVIAVFAWKNLQPVIKRWLRKWEANREASLHHKNPDILLNKLRVMDEARRKLQERYNIDAAKNLEKKLEKEKLMKEQKMEELESKQGGQGYRLRDSPSASASNSASNSSAKGKQTTKKVKLRPEYNPLTGDTGGSGSCQWRPSRARPSGGG